MHGDDIEVIYPTGLVKLDETFASPQMGNRYSAKCVPMAVFVLMNHNPSSRIVYISKGVRCSAIMRPVVDREIGVSASIRQSENSCNYSR